MLRNYTYLKEDIIILDCAKNINSESCLRHGKIFNILHVIISTLLIIS